MKLNDNIKDFINTNEKTFQTIEMIENGVLTPHEVLEALK